MVGTKRREEFLATLEDVATAISKKAPEQSAQLWKLRYELRDLVILTQDEFYSLTSDMEED